MSSCVEPPLVRFHDIELWAKLAAVLRLLGATVPVILLPERAVLQLGWHEDLVEGSDAATRQVRDIDIVADIAAKEVRLEV